MSYKTGLAEWDEKARLEHREKRRSGLQARVQRWLDGDKDLRGYGLKAQVTGGKVLVSGTVDTLAEKQRLENALKEIPGVEAVESAVALSTDGAVRDEEIEEEVRQELEAAPGVAGHRVGVTVRGGTAVLRGDVADSEEAQAAVLAAAKARGVRRVASHLQRRGRGEAHLEELFHGQVRNDAEQES
ncbi:MAG: BON domain-containing protein [Clostridia bacterium]|nr:BON domain-containing protein [Clostridia bacterium]